MNLGRRSRTLVVAFLARRRCAGGGPDTTRAAGRRQLGGPVLAASSTSWPRATTGWTGGAPMARRRVPSRSRSRAAERSRRPRAAPSSRQSARGSSSAPRIPSMGRSCGAPTARHHGHRHARAPQPDLPQPAGNDLRTRRYESLPGGRRRGLAIGLGTGGAAGDRDPPRTGRRCGRPALLAGAAATAHGKPGSQRAEPSTRRGARRRHRRYLPAEPDPALPAGRPLRARGRADRPAQRWPGIRRRGAGHRRERLLLVLRPLERGAGGSRCSTAPRSTGHLWVFYGSLSDVEYFLTVTDTQTSDSKTYHNPPGEVCGRADVTAF